jgi:hypothetical protein
MRRFRFLRRGQIGSLWPAACSLSHNIAQMMDPFAMPGKDGSTWFGGIG